MFEKIRESYQKRKAKQLLEQRIVQEETRFTESSIKLKEDVLEMYTPFVNLCAGICEHYDPKDWSKLYDPSRLHFYDDDGGFNTLLQKIRGASFSGIQSIYENLYGTYERVSGHELPTRIFLGFGSERIYGYACESVKTFLAKYKTTKSDPLYFGAFGVLSGLKVQTSQVIDKWFPSEPKSALPDFESRKGVLQEEVAVINNNFWQVLKRLQELAETEDHRVYVQPKPGELCRRMASKDWKEMSKDIIYIN